jgi:hypothetical protein
MAMTKCKECKKDVSSDAKSCPHCGVSNPAMGVKEFFIGLVTLAAIVYGVYSYFSSETDTATKKAQIKSVAVNQPATPIPTDSAQNEKSRKDDVVKASDFCLRSSKIIHSEEAAFKNFQAEMNKGQKKGSPRLMVEAINAYGVRANELNEDANGIPIPDLSSEKAKKYLDDAAISVRIIASNNTRIAENLRAMLSSEQSQERSQERAEEIGSIKDLHLMKYVIAINSLFDAYGFSPDDIDDATLCLKSNKT